MTSELDGATQPPPPGGAILTPGEFAALWNSRTHLERQQWLDAFRAASRQATLCREAHHA